jgi:hypothetical protein
MHFPGASVASVYCKIIWASYWQGERFVAIYDSWKLFLSWSLLISLNSGIALEDGIHKDS